MNKKPVKQWLPSALLLSLLLTIATNVQAEDTRFVAIGDTPYSEAEEQLLTSTIRKAIENKHPAFVVHLGDIKNGQSNCTDTLFTSRRDLINGLKPGYVFYTPGDNEWTDCDRASLSHPISELDRLERIRQKFFYEQAMNLPVEWSYTRQANFPENARWRKNNVMFTTLHMVGTNNGRQEILKDDKKLALSLVDARDQANRVWLDATFQQAQATNAAAIVIFTQADVTLESSRPHCSTSNQTACDAFAEFRQQLIEQAHRFNRPVLLMHGDTSPYCWDKRFGGATAPKLWRLNAWGDYRTPADATEVIVQSANATLPFDAQTLVSRQPPEVQCQ